MKRIYKYLAVTGLSAVICLFLAMPASAQRGGGGGGGSHGGGGGGGAHFSGGGGGGSHVSGGGSFSGSHYSGGSTGAHYSSGARTGYSSARGNYASRAGARGYAANGSRGYAGRAGYGRGGYGHGSYGHGGYGRAYGWGRHGGWFYANGFYASLYFPYLGWDCAFLPFGYYPFYWDNAEYYFSDGFYYQQNDDQYSVVEPPVGAAINALPSKAKSIQINGVQYYELNGVYYLPVTKDDGTIVYQVAGKDGTLDTDAGGGQAMVPKVGNTVSQLPPDCRKVTLGGQTFFVSEDGIYYQPTTDANGNKAYKIVGLEADQAQ
jgi:hypothetical protein